MLAVEEHFLVEKFIIIVLVNSKGGKIILILTDWRNCVLGCDCMDGMIWMVSLLNWFEWGLELSISMTVSC